MSDQAVSEILKRVDALAAKLGVTAEFLWSILVKQARIEVWTNVAVIAAAAIVAWGLYRWWRSALRRSDGNVVDLDSGGEFVSLVFATIFAIVVVIGAFVAILQLPTLLLNPEYWALKQLFQ